MTKITIIHPNCNPRKFKSRSSNSNVVWLSFGEDFDKIQKWDEIFSNFYKRLNVARDMESIYSVVCKKYSIWMADLGIKYNDEYPEWWLSPISEKNGWPPKYVVNECIIEYVKRSSHKCDYDEIVLITSSIFNVVEIKKMASTENFNYSVHGYRHYIFELIVLYIQHLIELLYFGFDFIINKFTLSKYCIDDKQPTVNKSNIVVLRTYCHNSSFKSNGQFIDIKFGDLNEKLEEMGFNVIYQPNLSSISNKKEIYKWFSEKAEDQFWILERYLTFTDLCKSYAHILKQLLLVHKLGYAVFLNLEPLLVITTGKNYLKSLLPIKLVQQKIEPDYVLFDWENKAYEKYMCILSKIHIPRSKVVGYISGIPFPTGPEVNLSSKEAKITPLPDKIVCCSQYVYDWLEHVGFDKTKLVVGPSIRQNHVFDNNTTSDDFILVALPLNYDLSFELISEVVLFARRNEKIDVLLKPHPFLDISTIMGANKPIPENISISNEDISNLFQKCKYFVYTGPTTTACEAFVLGKDVCRYISNNHFSLDCLHFKFNDSIFNFTNHIELGEYIIEGHQTKNITTGVKYKEYIFNRMGADYADVFIS